MLIYLYYFIKNSKTAIVRGERMEHLFDIKCKNCGSPVGYDIKTQTYRCKSCGEVTGIREVRNQIGYRALDSNDREVIKSERAVLSCPDCGAEVICEAGEESEKCSYCGGSLVRREFEESDQFPEYIIPFVLTPDEAKKRLLEWAESTDKKSEGKLIKENIDRLEGSYLPYTLVRGPVDGYVKRENVNREFNVRGFIENTLVSSSRQIDNETLDAIEPFDLDGLKPFEHGFIAGHRVKLADLSGAKRERRTLSEAGEDLKKELIPKFHTDGLRVNLYPSELMEIPVLLPVYTLKIGRRLAAVNGQTGRVAVKTALQKKRSPLWVLEPAVLSLLVFFSLWLATFSPLTALISCLPLLIVIWRQYRGGRFSVFGQKIQQGEQTTAKRKDGVLSVEKSSLITKNPFPTEPIFREMRDGVPTDVKYRFYPPARVISSVLKTLILYYLPAIIGALLYFAAGTGKGFNMMGSVIWFWCFGIFALVYVFSGIRSDAYEKPYTYNEKGTLLGPASSRRLPFLGCIGLDRESLSRIDEIGQTKKKVVLILILTTGILLLSIYGTISLEV